MNAAWPGLGLCGEAGGCAAEIQILAHFLQSGGDVSHQPREGWSLFWFSIPTLPYHPITEVA